VATPCSDYLFLFAEIELLTARAIIALGRDVFRYLRSVRRPEWLVIFIVLTAARRPVLTIGISLMQVC
jgi:hypothetical protein